MKRAMHVIGSSVLLSLAPMASAQEPDDDPVALRVAAGFESLAGSEDNSLALVRALHEGVAVRLVAPAAAARHVPEIVMIDPPTRPMSWNDVKMALMLARDALRRHAISKPTLEQLRAVLVGGEIATPAGKTVRFRGVLQMRADGFNWGAVAAERYRRND